MDRWRLSVSGWCRRARRLVAVVVVLAFLPLMVSCYGAFPLTHAIYDINGTVPTGILETVVFWVFAVTAYPVAMVVDALALNVIEFWTGVAVYSGSFTDEGGTTYAMEPSADGTELALTISRDGEVQGRMLFVKLSDEVLELRDAEGEPAGRMVREDDGAIRLTDAAGGTVNVIEAGRVADLLARRGTR